MVIIYSSGVNFAEEFLNLLFDGTNESMKQRVCQIYDEVESKSQSEYSWILHPDVDIELCKCTRKHLRKLDLKQLLRRCNNQGATLLHYASALDLPVLLDLLLDVNKKKFDKEEEVHRIYER